MLSEFPLICDIYFNYLPHFLHDDVIEIMIGCVLARYSD